MPANRSTSNALKVVYIDAAGPFGGASRSLFEAVRAMPSGAVDARMVVKRGSAAAWYSRVAREITTTPGLTRFDNTRYSYYRGVRWLVLAREIAYLPVTMLTLMGARWRWRDVDIVHANEITDVIPLLIAKWLWRARAVVHVRAVQRTAHTARDRFVLALLRRCDAVVAIDETVRASLPPGVRVDVVHNSFSTSEREPTDAALATRLGGPRRALRIGYVGSLHHAKGLLDLVDAASVVHASGRDVEYFLLGDETRRSRTPLSWLLRRIGLAQDIRGTLQARLAASPVAGRFHLLGASADIHTFLEGIDVICFPSHFDAPGRPIFEAAWYGVPAIAAITEPRPDTIVSGETGLCVRPRTPDDLAAAIAHCHDHRDDVARMGALARALAESNFAPRRNALTLLEIYARIVGRAAVGAEAGKHGAELTAHASS
jgi:glycosyltransferase involved in cell wall biosynthesis